jgi:dihydroorotase
MVGLKLFAGHSTGGMGIVDRDVQALVYDTLVRSGYQGVVAVHCEKESLLLPSLWDSSLPDSHCDARPAEAEVQSIADQIACVRSLSFKGILHICHISTAASIALVVDARRSGLRITCGATPHHALLDRTAASRAGNLLKMNPPLRGKEDAQAVFKALLDGSIDWMESDHAPHTLREKALGASGIPGFAGCVLLVSALRAAGASEPRLQSICGEALMEAWDVRELPPVEVPDASRRRDALHAARAAYAWDPFDSIEFPEE